MVEPKLRLQSVRNILQEKYGKIIYSIARQ